MTTELRKLPPYFRAYSHIAREMLPFGILTTNNDFYIKDGDGKSVKVDGVEIDFFLGRFCEDGSPLYENDVVEVATLNEFGSAVLETGVIRFDIENLCYTIGSSLMEGDDMPLPTKIVRVIGHNHGN